MHVERLALIVKLRPNRVSMRLMCGGLEGLQVLVGRFDGRQCGALFTLRLYQRKALLLLHLLQCNLPLRS